MKTVKLICLLLVTCLAGTHQAQSQAVSALPLLTSPATNDFWNLLDVSDTSIHANGRQKKVPVQAGIWLAENNLRNLTTTGTVTASTALRSARLDVTNGVDTVGQFGAVGSTLQILNTGGGFTDLLADEFGGVRIDVNGLVSIFDDTGSLELPGNLDVVGNFNIGTIQASGVVGFNGAVSLGNNSADAITGNGTGTWPGRQTFQQVSGIQNNHGNQSTAVTVQVSTNAHRVALTGDATITIGGTAPAAPARTVLELELVQDGTGGRTPTISPTPANGQPVIDETASAITLVYLRTSDGGSTWQAFSSYDSGGGGTGNDLGVRSEFIPVGYMRDTGVSAPAAAVNTTSGNGIVETRFFNDPSTEGLIVNWQRPRDAVDAVAGGDFQLKWRWVGVSPPAGLSSDTIALGLQGVGKATGDGLNSTFGTASYSNLTSATHAAEDWILGPWSEVTFTTTTEGVVTFFLQFDATTSTDDLRLAGIELLFSTNLDAVTYASP